MLALFLLYIFLVWIFSWCDLFQVTGADASCVLCIICPQFITFEQVMPIAPGMLYSWDHLIPFRFTLALTCLWLNLIVQFTSEFSLSCTGLCLALRTAIMSFHRSLFFLLRLKVITSI